MTHIYSCWDESCHLLIGIDHDYRKSNHHWQYNIAKKDLLVTYKCVALEFAPIFFYAAAYIVLKLFIQFQKTN